MMQHINSLRAEKEKLKVKLQSLFEELFVAVIERAARLEYNPVAVVLNPQQPGEIQYIYPDYENSLGEEEAFDSINRYLVESKATGAIFAHPSREPGKVLFTLLAPGYTKSYTINLEDSNKWSSLETHNKNFFPMITAFRRD